MFPCRLLFDSSASRRREERARFRAAPWRSRDSRRQIVGEIPLTPLAEATGGKTVVVSLITDQSGCHVGCPAESLIVIEK